MKYLNARFPKNVIENWTCDLIF